MMDRPKLEFLSLKILKWDCFWECLCRDERIIHWFRDL